MKKALSLILALVMCLSLFACNSDKSEEKPTQATTEPTEEAGTETGISEDSGGTDIVG